MPMRPKPIALAGVLAVMVLTSTVGVMPAAADDQVVTVQPGQTLGQIAADHGISSQRLMRLTPLTDPNRIYAGQRLRLAPPRHRDRGAAAPRRQLVAHRVAYGETLSAIAARYHISVNRLVRRNHLPDASRIYAGQLLRIRMVPIVRNARGAPRHHGMQHTAFVTHVVRFAETLSGIALRYHVDLDSLVVANDIANPSFIRVGEKLRVPGRHRTHHQKARHHETHHRRRHAVRWRMPDDMAAMVRGRVNIGRIIRAEARARHVPPAFAMAVAWQESGWQERIVSSAGAIGVMQLLPSTADWVSATMLGHGVNLWDARSNVRAGVALLKHYLRRYDGSRPLALAAYYQGQAGTDRHGIYPVSRPYIDSILILESMFRGR
jgi:LysM repeat protein